MRQIKHLLLSCVVLSQLAVSLQGAWYSPQSWVSAAAAWCLPKLFALFPTAFSRSSTNNNHDKTPRSQYTTAQPHQSADPRSACTQSPPIKYASPSSWTRANILAKDMEKKVKSKIFNDYRQAFVEFINYSISGKPVYLQHDKQKRSLLIHLINTFHVHSLSNTEKLKLTNKMVMDKIGEDTSVYRHWVRVYTYIDKTMPLEESDIETHLMQKMALPSFLTAKDIIHQQKPLNQ